MPCYQVHLFLLNPHEFVQLLISALSSKETIGHQHPLLLHCTVMHLTQHGNGVFEIPKCSKFFKAPNLIDHVLFYPMHVKQVSDDLPVTDARTTMAKWICGEMDASLSGVVKIQKHLSEVPCWKNGEPSFWHHEDHDLFTCDMQTTYHEHQVPLQDIHNVHFDLEDLLSFQDFEEAIVLGNGSDLPMKPCLLVVARSFLVHHDNLFSKASKGYHAQLFPEKVVGNNGKQESYALTVAGTISKLSASRKLVSTDIKFLQVFPMSILLENTCMLIPLMGSNFLLSMVILS